MVTRRASTTTTELFGIAVPVREYHQAFVPDFNAGAMENPGCVTLRDSSSSAAGPPTRTGPSAPKYGA